MGPDRLHRLRRAAGAHRAAARPLRRAARLARRRASSRTRSPPATCCPGPASTQLAIFCAWRLRGRPGRARRRRRLHRARASSLILALVGAVPRRARRRRGCSAPAPGAGAAVAAVAVQAGVGLAAGRAGGGPGRPPLRWALYAAGRRVAAAPRSAPGSCSSCSAAALIELAARAARAVATALVTWRAAAPVAVAATRRRAAPLAWVAFKVGALSYGGGFVIIPLMQADAVDRYHWMTDGAVPQRGRARPGHAGAGRAHGRRGRLRAPPASGGGLLAARGRVRAVVRVRPARRRAASTGCAPTPGPARSSTAPARPRSARSSARRSRWRCALQRAVAGTRCSPPPRSLLLFALRRGVVLTLLAAGAVGVVVALAGGPLPKKKNRG